MVTTTALRSTLLTMAALLSPTASAMSGGAFGASGDDSTFVCANCHTESTRPPAITASALTGVTWRPGDTARFLLTVQRAAGSAGRVAGFAVSTDDAGVFADPLPALSEVRVASSGGVSEATHRRPKRYDAGGTVTWDLELRGLAAGRHHLFVGVNDANDDRSTRGDGGAQVDLIVLVCPQDGSDRDGDGVVDVCDVCPDVRDPAQADRDNDGVGDACDLCPDTQDLRQGDLDGDGLGDACDADTDDCAVGADSCDDNAACIDRPFVDFDCVCNDGFIGSGFRCDAVNECVDGVVGCGQNATCEDTVGSFICRCNAGYVGDGLTCVDVDECVEGTDTCDVDATCINTIGGFTCSCHEGFTGDGFSCVDINECRDDPCEAPAICINSAGDFACTCGPDAISDGAGCRSVAIGEGEGEGEREGEGPPPAPSTGCAASGATTPFLLAGLLWSLRRRRPGQGVQVLGTPLTR